jgi:hypothetical protein
MGEQLIVSKMPKTRGVVGHGIRSASNMVVTKTVTVMTLMKTGKP